MEKLLYRNKAKRFLYLKMAKKRNSTFLLQNVFAAKFVFSTFLQHRTKCGYFGLKKQKGGNFEHTWIKCTSIIACSDEKPVLT